MRLNLILALAPYIGSELTTEAARAIVNSLFWDAPMLGAEQERWGEFTFQQERLAGSAQLREQRIAFLSERWPERPQRIDWSYLEELESTGALVIFTARASSALAASIWAYRRKNVDSGIDSVTDDFWYVAPQHRNSSVGIRLWKYGEKALFDAGAREAVFSMRSDNNALRAAKFLGYTPIATRVMKTVQGNDFNLAPTRHFTGAHDE